MEGIKRETVMGLLKTASARLMAQEQELAELRAMHDNQQKLAHATSVADRMVQAGHLDLMDRDIKAQELAEDPSRLPVIEEAINMVQNPSAFQVASISDEPTYGGNARSQLESYLVGLD
jgi:hypothetical protein